MGLGRRLGTLRAKTDRGGEAGEAGGLALSRPHPPPPGWALCTPARRWSSRLTSTAGRPSAHSLRRPQDSGSSSQVLALKSRVPEMGLCAVERQEGPETGLVWGDRKAQRQGWWSGETGGPRDGAGVG